MLRLAITVKVLRQAAAIVRLTDFNCLNLYFSANNKGMQKIQNYIGGKLVEPNAGAYLDNYQPATGKVYSQIPDSDATDVQLAVNAAKAAFPEWSAKTRAERSQIMMNVSQLFNDNLDWLSEDESRDNG